MSALVLVWIGLGVGFVAGCTWSRWRRLCPDLVADAYGRGREDGQWDERERREQELRMLERMAR